MIQLRNAMLVRSSITVLVEITFEGIQIVDKFANFEYSCKEFHTLTFVHGIETRAFNFDERDRMRINISMTSEHNTEVLRVRLVNVLNMHDTIEKL